MNALLILSTLKKGWSYTKGFLALALKYWYIVVIALMLVINSSLRNDIVDLNNDKNTLNNNLVALVQKQKTDLLEAQKKAQDKEIEILTKQKEVEVKYNEQIKALSNDVLIARDSANSLQQKLNSNASKFNTLTHNQAVAYNNTISNLFSESIEEYREMGSRADDHRLAEERCVGLYNTLVDGVDKPDTNNKE